MQKSAVRFTDIALLSLEGGFLDELRHAPVTFDKGLFDSLFAAPDALFQLHTSSNTRPNALTGFTVTPQIRSPRVLSLLSVPLNLESCIYAQC